MQPSNTCALCSPKLAPSSTKFKEGIFVEPQIQSVEG